MRIWPLLPFLLAACTDPGTVFGRVSWVEARWLPDTLALRVIGTTGCGQLTGMAVNVAWRVDSSAVFVALDVLATIAGTSCQPANAFDTSFARAVRRPAQQAIAFVTSGTRSQILAESTDSGVARWFGGRADVIAPAPCPLLQLSRGYSVDAIPNTPLDPGTRLFVRGTLPATPVNGCATEPHATLTFHEILPPTVP